MKLQYLERVTDRKAKPLTAEVFDQLVQNPKTKFYVEKAREALAQGDKEHYSKWKSLLPAIMWVGYNPDGERKAEMLEPTQLYMVDIDHMREDPRKVWTDEILPLLTEHEEDYFYHVKVAHVTPSGKGLRIVAEAVEGFSTVKENMDWLVKRLELDKHGDYDSACKDFSRLSFIVGENDILFIDSDIFTDEPITHRITKAYSDEIRTSENEQPGSPAEDAASDAESASESSDLQEKYAKIKAEYKYRGRLLAEIADRYVAEVGSPMEGERHNFYNKLVKHFRNLCENDATVLHACLPRFGLPFAETEKQCKGLTRDNRTSRHEKAFYWFLVDNGYYPRAEEMTDKELKELLESEPREVDVPVPVLPPVFREFVAMKGGDFSWPTIYSLMPIMGTLASYLRSEYIDHEPLSTTFYSLIYAGAGMGKSFCKPFEQKLFEMVKVRDSIATMREQIYLKSKKADDSNSANPHVLVRKMALINSQAEFLEKMYDNRGYHMFTFAEEVDSFIKGTKAAGGDKTDMLRIAWDNGEYSQSFKSANSFKGTVNMYYNILMTGTPDQIKKAFPNIENGMITRVCFCPLLNQEFAKFPIPKKLTLKQVQVIEKFMARCDENTYREPLDFTLEEAREVDEKDFDKQVPWKYSYRDFQTVDLSWLFPHIMKWLESKRIEALLSQDHAKDTFRRRVGRMGASLGLLCYACWDKVGKREEEVIRNFVLAFMEKDLKERLRLYGDSYNALMNEGAKLTAKSSKNNPSLYAELPDTFTKEDVIAKAQRLGIYSPVKSIIYRWKSEGLVARGKEKNSFVKVTKMKTKTKTKKENGKETDPRNKEQ